MDKYPVVSDEQIEELLGGSELYRTTLDEVRVWVHRNDTTGQTAVLSDASNGQYGLIAVLSLELLPSGDVCCSKERMRIASRHRATLEALALEMKWLAGCVVRQDREGYFYLELAEAED